jgi:ketopantoate reductase
MLDDLERGRPTEAGPIIGDLLRRGGGPGACPLLGLVHTHLETYAARRARG